MKNLPKFILAALVAVVLSGCASVFSGTSQAISIDSNIQGASIAIDGNVIGVTPFAGKVPRRKDSIAIISKAGYASQPVALSTTFNPLAIVSILCWDLGTTDCLTGACWEYAPASYYVNLRPAGSSLNEFQRDTQLKAFAMTYHGDLQTELAAGTGAKIDGMRATYFKDMSQAAFVAALRAIDADAKGNAVAFGEKVTAIASR
jgi:hypothetical protein